MEKLDEHFPHSVVDQLEFDIHKYLKMLKRIEQFYYVLDTILIVHFCSMPFLHQIYAKYKSLDLKWEAILSLNLGFDQTQPVIFELIIILEIWLTIFNVFFVIYTDLLYACLMQILKMELDILSQVMGEICRSNNEEDAIKELKKLIDIHQELIEVSEKLNEIFSPLMLINVACSIVGLCTAGFLVASGINNYFIARYFFVPIGLIVQIFVQCFFAQQLIDSTAAISTSVYNTEWYSGSVKLRRFILLIIYRSQKPQTIKAWKFFDLSMATFYWIVTKAHSYYSVLKAVYF
ncbi:putative odorant receptor 92a [Chironomus tepperi]|uniref:putative odorant receptor 92a n=1 Tax=Chironomus tepperi TaxID=113505 RepID=UPI00391EF533